MHVCLLSTEALFTLEIIAVRNNMNRNKSLMVQTLFPHKLHWFLDMYVLIIVVLLKL